MEPMITISVKDYNELVRNSGNKRVIKALKIIINRVLYDVYVAMKHGSNYNVVDGLQSFIKKIQSEDSCFEEIIERYKNDSLHESTEEDKEGSEVR